jgi:hypothetical protein
LASYTLFLLHPASRVKIKIREIQEILQFSVVAKATIPDDTRIYELVGLLASSNEGRATSVSMYEISKQQGKLMKPRKDKSVLLGPLRFVNHCCEPNVEVFFFLPNLKSS